MDNKIFDEIKNQVDIVDVIGNYVDLSRIGKNLKGLCPFHSDTHPSMIVSPEKQIFTCFSCGATGNVFTFVRDIEKINYIDAVRKVCQISGISIPTSLEYRETNKPVNKYQRYYDLIKDLTIFYSYQLKSNPDSNANKYIKSRNLSSEDVEYFKIGFCPDNGFDSINFLKNKGYSDDEIITSGIGSDLGNGNIIDRLRGRVIFSITDSEGRVVAFSGRRINDGIGEKYVNTPETILFHKSNILYNYSNAIVNSKKDGYCYVVEGFMDAIALHKAGLRNVVATMGTAFTDDHIKLLSKLRCQIRLLFDADVPGQNATNKAIEALINTNLKLSVVIPLSNSKDIDELLQKEGKEAVVSRVNNLETVIQWKINFIANRTNFNNHEDVKEFIKESVDFLVKCNVDSIDLEFYCDEIAKLAKVSSTLIKNQFNKENSSYQKETYDYIEDDRSYVSVAKHLNKYEQADHQILKKMIESPLNIIAFKNANVSLSDRNCRLLANLIIDRYSRNEEISYAALLNEAPLEISKLIGELNREEYPEIELEELFKIISIDYLRKIDKEDLLRQLNNETDPIRQAEIAQKIVEINKQISDKN